MKLSSNEKRIRRTRARRAKTREELLSLFQAKAGCHRTQDVAFKHWETLEPMLTDAQRKELSIEWGHHRDQNLGRDRIDEQCRLIREAWAKEAQLIG